MYSLQLPNWGFIAQVHLKISKLIDFKHSNDLKIEFI